MRPRNESEQNRIDRLRANPLHKQADLWLENDSSAKYAFLTILFENGIRIEFEIPLAKACILVILQKFYEIDGEQPGMPDTLRGRCRRGGIANEYRVMHRHAKPLAGNTVTQYMTAIQRAIQQAIRGAPCISVDGEFPDILFERGKSWGVRIRPPGLVVHRSGPPTAAPLSA